MAEFIKLCRVTDIPEGRKGSKFEISDDLEIVLFKINGEIYAIENTCPHNHTHNLHEGFVDEHLNIECPIHGWKFNLLTGKPPEKVQGASAKLQIFPVKIDNNFVFVKPEKMEFKFNF